MNGKFFFMLAVLISNVYTGFSQKATVGVQGGLNFSAAYEAFWKVHYKTCLKSGFNAGVNLEIPLSHSLYLQPGLLFSTKGSIHKDSRTRTSISYIELPVNMLVRLLCGNGNLLLGTGPYLAAGVGGSFGKDSSGARLDLIFDGNINATQLFSNNRYMKRWDGGINLLAGYEFANHISVQLNGQLGLRDTSPKLEGETVYYKNKNVGFGLSFGYRFKS